ncbi:alpha/beta hydrolase family protein [Chloroflexota bacterium]
MQIWRVVFPVLVVVLLVLSLPGSIIAQDDEALPLAETGPYGVGTTTLNLVDENREDRELVTDIWYPGVLPEGENQPRYGLRDAEPDDSGAPYSLLIYSHAWSGSRQELLQINKHLVSHGFVVAAMDHMCNRGPNCLTVRPMDVLFVLDELADTESDLAAIIDTDNVGVFGYSDGGYTSVAVSGAQIDPLYFSEWWAEHGDGSTIVSIDLWNAPWDEVVAYRAQFDSLESDELWPPLTDERIKAVMHFAPCYGPLFGEQGLAAVTIPTLIVDGTLDQFCPYIRDSVFIVENIGSDQADLLTLVDTDHMFLFRSNLNSFWKQFSTAFFGQHLQGQENYAEYLTEEYVEQFEGLAWGVYEEE